MNNDTINSLARFAIDELLQEDDQLNDDDFADYAQIILINSTDADARALAYDETTLGMISDAMINYCDTRNISH
jgi:hypothetical protein